MRIALCAHTAAGRLDERCPGQPYLPKVPVEFILEKLNVVAKLLMEATCERVRLETRDRLPLVTHMQHRTNVTVNYTNHSTQ